MFMLSKSGFITCDVFYAERSCKNVKIPEIGPHLSSLKMCWIICVKEDLVSSFLNTD
jgi:hypothetical protein